MDLALHPEPHAHPGLSSLGSQFFHGLISQPREICVVLESVSNCLLFFLLLLPVELLTFVLNPHQQNRLPKGQKCPYSCSVAPAALCWPSVGTVVNPLSRLAWNRSSFFALSQFSCFLFLLLKKCGCTLRILQVTLKHLPSPCYQWLSPYVP